MKALFVLAFALAGGRILTAQTPEAKEALAKSIVIQQALRSSDGLHKAALAKGGRFATIDNLLPRNRSGSIEQLVYRSNEIFEGTVISSKAALADNGRELVTVFTLQVQKILSGSSTAIVQVAVPGGIFRFADGSQVVSESPKIKRPLLKHRYLVFCTADQEVKGQFRLAASDESTFELDAQHRAFSHASDPTNGLHKVAANGESALISEVQAVIAKSKK